MQIVTIYIANINAVAVYWLLKILPPILSPILSPILALILPSHCYCPRELRSILPLIWPLILGENNAYHINFRLRTFRYVGLGTASHQATDRAVTPLEVAFLLLLRVLIIIIIIIFIIIIVIVLIDCHSFH